ncbi:MAG TPA: SDR family oxidoreductase [Bryobacteraceae bacterium]|jgi:NAD(P)-dependent dehydrogenase (short-subunit alcohol dehydrogenase family)
MRTLAGTTALVTGGSRGIGRAICLRLAEMGASIILHYHRNEQAANETASAIGGEVKLVHANLASPHEIERMFEGLEGLRLNFLINNAGVWKGTPLGASSPELVDEVVDTNLKGPFLVTQCALPVLQDGGRIINISSVAGRTGVAGGRSLYGAAKAGMDALTRNWALELAPRGILVNAVAPGYLATDMTADHFADPATYERALTRHPLGRLCTPKDVADVVAFLCSDGARFITGQSINVSGGFVI